MHINFRFYKIFLFLGVYEKKMHHVLDEEKFKEWKIKRRNTLIIFCMQCLANGMTYTMFNNTFWVYIENQLKPDKPYQIYSLTIFLFYLPTMLFSFISSNIYDRYRRCCRFMIIINFISIIGSVMYVIDFSIYLPLTGCLLLGCRLLIQPAIIGDLARSYAPEDSTYVLPLTNLFFYFGSVPASIILFLAKDMNLQISIFHVTYGNCCGLVMALFFFLQEILIALFAHDLSREFDFKEYILQAEIKTRLENNERDVNEEEQSTSTVYFSGKITGNGDCKSIIKDLKRVVTNFDVNLVYFLVFLFDYIGSLIFGYLPLLIQVDLKYTVDYLNIYYLTFSIIFAIFLPVLIFVKLSSKWAYRVGLASFILLPVIVICLKVINKNEEKIFNVGWLSLIAFLLGVVYTGEDIFLTCTVAKFVQPDIQSFADGIRTVSAMIGLAFGNLSISLFFHHCEVFSVALLIILVISILAIIIRKRTLEDPKAIV